MLQLVAIEIGRLRRWIEKAEVKCIDTRIAPMDMVKRYMIGFVGFAGERK